MHNNVPLLPITIQDQLRLYETELHRVQKTEGVLYADFSSARQYAEALEYAQRLQCVVHDCGREKGAFFVSLEGHELIKEWVGRMGDDSGGGGY